MIYSWFITGFTDGEGCFYIGIVKSSSRISDYSFQVCFTINLHEKDRAILETIQNYFGVGSIYKEGAQTIQYKVQTIKDLAIIIEHFW